VAKLKRVVRIQVIEGAGWQDWPYGVKVDGELWLNRINKPHPFKTEKAAVKAVMRHLCLKVAEVLPTERKCALANTAVNS
jgi:hypothetical protein